MINQKTKKKKKFTQTREIKQFEELRRSRLKSLKRCQFKQNLILLYLNLILFHNIQIFKHTLKSGGGKNIGIV